MASADLEFHRGLAGCLGGIGAILFGTALELGGYAFGTGVGSGFAFVGLGVAVAGDLSGAVGINQVERSATDHDG